MPVTDAQGGEAPTFTAFNKAREQQAMLMAMVATPIGQLKQKLRWRDYLMTHNLPSRTAETLKDRVNVLEHRLAAAKARRELSRFLARHARKLFLGIDITAASGNVGLIAGDSDIISQCMPADAEVFNQVTSAADKLDEVAAEPYFSKTRRDVRRARNLLRASDASSLAYIPRLQDVFFYWDSVAPLHAGHPSFTFSTISDSRRWMGTPFDTLDNILTPDNLKDIQADEEKTTPLQDLETLTQLLTAVSSQFARGYGKVAPISFQSDLHTIEGQVLSKLGGENLTPDQEMPGAIVRIGPLEIDNTPYKAPLGVGKDLCVAADWEGKFRVANVWGEMLSKDYANPIDIDAAITDRTSGEIRWTLSMKESGPLAPYSVRNVKIATYDNTLAMPILFRAKPVQVIPMTDPATFRHYAGFDFIDTKGLTRPENNKTEQSAGTYVCYVPPETKLYFTFKKGSLNNPNLMTVRAFALNAAGPADGAHINDRSEIVGPGYLAADYSSVNNVELDAAVSMAQVNSRRLDLQEKYNMADDMLLSYNRKAVELAEQARDLAEKGDIIPAKQKASESLAYSSNIHPVIRKNASDAVLGILFYLLLAIPFAVFLEKLLIGHPDLRWQICYQGVIFLVFFMALRVVHPAYELVRSSYMILLGFVTFALAAMVSTFVAGRFRYNIAQLQQRLRKSAEVADVSRAGALMTAFVLGLGHMRRRPVRTGLTVATLILITFVMLCFTSVTTNVVDVEFAVGKAPYTGLFIRDRNLRNVAGSLNPLRELYGKEHTVVPRNWGGTFSAPRGEAVKRAEYDVIRTFEGKDYESQVNAVLGLTPDETRITPVSTALITSKRWFKTTSEYSCFLPRRVADELNIRESDLLNGPVSVTVGSREYDVLGIFDGIKMDAVLDLDGESLLPLDVLGLLSPDQRQQQTSSDETTQVPEDIPRLPGSRVIITPSDSMPSTTMTASVAVAFQGLAYKDARAMITTHLERSAEPTYYGIDGIAFYGGKFRRRSLEGLLGLILPIIIAAMTVLNTMRGSVYERQNELYVFNSVGLSPSHIRALFIAEASVYAVVGAVGGYLLAQSIGTGLRMLDLTAGLTLNYSSLSSVLVTVIIMLVVYASSIFPAKMAARLAAPADLMARKRSTAEGDVMELDLPFTFNHRDRIAILPYFSDWLENFGEGSSGEFFCSDPQCFVREEKNGTFATGLETVTWLKPYDLGVSQTVTIVVRHYPDTGDNVATVIMTRRSGDSESWERCCHAFIGLLRKRFLTWRAVTDELRAQLLERGQNILDNT
ncbi:MAG: hypothetical protein K9N51_12890, partial [Candidatus Pacebacteria bacterium]|nr:hypothetical protein [Candidatus Paceibacterota bacterium]